MVFEEELILLWASLCETRYPTDMKIAFHLRVLVILAMSTTCVFADGETPEPISDTKPHFSLQGRNGTEVSVSSFRGRHLLLTFGFTNCTHICPMLVAKMAFAMNLTNADVAGVFVSVDTERDSPTIADDYAKSFGSSMLGLGGTYQQVGDAVRALNATYVVTKSQDTYSVQHTPYIFLFGPDGTLIDTFSASSKPEEIAAAIH